MDMDYLIIDAREPNAPKVVEDAALDRHNLPAGYRLAPDVAGFRRKLANPDRRMIGDKQLEWLKQELAVHAGSQRRWFVLGSATILSSYMYPDLAKLGSGPAEMAPFYAMTRYGLPVLNLDSWDGYPAERERLYNAIDASGANVLVLSGDSHMAWVNEPHRGDRRLALELSASSITGPSLGELMLPDGPVGEAFARDNRDVVWCDHRAIGYVAVTLTAESVEGRFVRVLAPRSTNHRVDNAMTASATIEADGRLGGWKLRT